MDLRISGAGRCYLLAASSYRPRFCAVRKPYSVQYLILYSYSTGRSCAVSLRVLALLASLWPE